MTRYAGLTALFLTFAAAASCGRKGPLQMPVAKEPQPVSSASAFQRDARIILEWTNPVKYADGRPLGTPEAVEVWVVEGKGEALTPLKPADIERLGRLAMRLPKSGFRPSERGGGEGEGRLETVFPFDAARAGSARFLFSFRVLDARRHASEFSTPFEIQTRDAPAPPRLDPVRVLADRLEVRWQPPTASITGGAPPALAGYRVFRSEDRGPWAALTPAPVPGPVFEDRDFAFGRAYAYKVRASAEGTEPPVESGDSAVVEVTPKDEFPPAPPQGLVAMTGNGVVSLSWEPGGEGDLAGYRVWRREAGSAEFIALTAEPVAGTVFSDASARPGTPYVYAVSSLDTAGNESAKTESSPVTLKGTEA
jgi:predicted small lipoprotein YifL